MIASAEGTEGSTMKHAGFTSQKLFETVLFVIPCAQMSYIVAVPTVPFARVSDAEYHSKMLNFQVSLFVIARPYVPQRGEPF